MKTHLRHLLAALLLFTAGNLHAQWVTQSITLKPGWNSVYLFVDASYTNLDTLIGADPSNPISEVWLWQPVIAPGRFINDPATPLPSNVDWAVWTRSGTVPTTISGLLPNAAYLIRNNSGANYTWNLVGQPVPPRNTWTAQGVNFIGFSTPAVNPPVFDNFLSPSPLLQNQSQIFFYPGGEAANAAPTTRELLARFSTPVNRGQAYWIRAGNQYNSYFGPVLVTPQSASGVRFGDTLGQYSIRLRNVTAGTLQVTTSLLPSAAAPAGQVAHVGLTPLLLRGPRNMTNLTYSFINFSTPQVVTLAPQGQPGSDVEIILGLNRQAMNATPGNPGDLFAGVLRLTDSLGYSQTDLPVSALRSSPAGLWVGNANVTQVRAYLKSYQMGPDGKPALAPAAANGVAAYAVTNIDTSLTRVQSSFPLRLIYHVGTNSEIRLVQRIFSGTDRQTNDVLTTKESLLDPTRLATARRISAVHLPWSKLNAGWLATGNFAQGQSITNVITMDYNDHSSNPFLHTYHPDHDNLNATFDALLPVGAESFQLQRRIVLTFTAPPVDFTALTEGSSKMLGTFAEEITFIGRSRIVGNVPVNDTRTFSNAGDFELQRVSTLPKLTTQ